MAKKQPDPEADRENAYICLFCTKETCTGAEACLKEQKKKRARQYQADRRAAKRDLDAFYNAKYSKEHREKLAEAKEAYSRKKAIQ